MNLGVLIKHPHKYVPAGLPLMPARLPASRQPKGELNWLVNFGLCLLVLGIQVTADISGKRTFTFEPLWLSVELVGGYLVFVNELLDVHSFFTGGWSSFSVIDVRSSLVCASLISVFIHVIPGMYSDTRFVTLLIKEFDLSYGFMALEA